MFLAEILGFGISSRLVPVVVGAAIALAGAILVQLWLVPSVDTRRRREQRWEQDVLTLGELLTFELPEAISDFRVSLHTEVALAEGADPRLAVVIAEQQEATRAARRLLRLQQLRADWLADRVISLAPESRTLQALAKQRSAFFMSYARLTILECRPDAESPLTNAQVNEAGERLATSTKALVDALKTLATGAPPRRTRRGTLRALRQGQPS